MTLRRAGVLIRSLPPDSLLWSLVREAEQKALKPTPEQIRERAAHYARQKEAAT
jgi:hypothetical protein